MRKYLKWGVALLVANMALVSCEDNNDTDDVRIQKPILTVSDLVTSGVEGEEITFTVTSDRPIANPIDLKLEVVNDESVATFRDFTAPVDETDIGGGGYGQGQIGYLLSFPAYATSHTFTITLERDLLIEGSEQLELLLRSAGNGLGLVEEGSQRLSIAVSDYVSNDIAIRLDWGGDTYNSFGTLVEGPFHEYDFDIYVFNATSFDEVTAYAGATGNLPENVVLLNEDLADGEYLILADLYAKPTTLPTIPVAIPAMLTVSKFGVWSETIQLPFMTSSPASGGGGLAGGEIVAAVLTKTGTTYTLSTEDGEVLASGRMSQISNLIGRR